MKPTRLTLACLIVCIALPAAAKETPRPRLAHDGEVLLYSTSAHGLAERETAGPDTFVLYGGPDEPLEGKFETASGAPDFQGWVSVDLTELPRAWQVSTFQAENLNGNGAGNHAYWCGQDAAQQTEWLNAPGYGNNWIQDLIWESPPVADTNAWQTVDLDFFFNHDLEPEYDYFEVAFEYSSNWWTVYQATGKDLNLQYAAIDTNTALPIRFEPHSYGGPNHDQIRIRFRVITDGAFSDEDGFFISDGAVQMDDVSITWSDGSIFEDFEGPGPYQVVPDLQPFAGDFASVLTLLTDVDACRSNVSPGVAFIDYGQEVNNAPGVDGTVSTGGATSPKIEYGIPGHYIVNPEGGIAPDGANAFVDNHVVSPEIPWNLPGSADDGDEMVGALLRYDVWNDLPNANLTGRMWAVRARTLGGNWGPWQDRGFINVSDSAVWKNVSDPIGDLLIEDGIPDAVQIRLGVIDVSELFGWGSNTDATPAPVFDNVTLLKYRVPGPLIRTADYSLANDGFPRFPVLDVSTPVMRDLLDIAFDQIQERNFWSAAIIPGDSVTVDVVAFIPGTEVTDIRMFWALQKNPLFEDDIRNLPARPQDQNTVAGVQVWSGEVVASESFTSAGFRVADRYDADLPDVDFMYPGDVLHYYFRATDNHGRVSTLPANTSGFMDFSEYSVFDREFMVRGLPSIRVADGTQPETLVVYDAEHGHEAEVILAFRELGATEGVDFDTYRVGAARRLQSNGIGSFEGHGASAAQLDGYENILYLSGSLTNTLSDGTDQNLNDKSDDLSLIRDWSQLPGTRRIAYFGDSIAQNLRFGSLGTPFMAYQMGVEWLGDDVNDVIGGQFAPRVAPVMEPFYSEFIASGGCFSIANFDHIGPTGTGYVPWMFFDAGGSPIPNAAAAVMNDRVNGFDVLFPIAFHRIENAYMRRILPNARALIIQELFELESYCIVNPCTGTIPGRVPIELIASPNPFNPFTVVKFTGVGGTRGSVKVYNLRGELVRVLHAGEFVVEEFRWDGADDNGASVASGVYIVRAETEGRAHTAKVALVK